MQIMISLATGQIIYIFGFVILKYPANTFEQIVHLVRIQDLFCSYLIILVQFLQVVFVMIFLLLFAWLPSFIITVLIFYSLVTFSNQLVFV